MVNSVSSVQSLPQPSNLTRRRFHWPHLMWGVMAGVVWTLYLFVAVFSAWHTSRTSSLSFAFELPLRGAIRTFEFVGVDRMVRGSYLGFFFGNFLLAGLAVGFAFMAWNALRLTWERAKYVLLSTSVALVGLCAYSTFVAEVYQRTGFFSGPALGLGHRGDLFTCIGLGILFSGLLALVIISPRWQWARPRVLTPARTGRGMGARRSAVPRLHQKPGNQ